MTSESFLGKITEVSLRLGVNVKLHCLPCSSIFEAACARLHIFDWPAIGSYEKVLYLDTDIIIRRDISRLFTLDLEDKMYGYPSGTLESPQFGGQFFDFSRIDHRIVGVNSGTLLFKRCPVIRDLFTRIRAHIHEHVSHGKPIPTVMDQPFINYHAFISGLCNTCLLVPYISLYEDTLEVSNAETAMICHFSYPIGNFGHKYARMTEFLAGLLTPTGNGILDILGKRFSWDKGYIAFGSQLETSWGKGLYTIHQGGIVRAVWNNHEHIIKFTEDLTSYISIRIAPKDFNCVFGSFEISQ